MLRTRHRFTRYVLWLAAWLGGYMVFSAAVSLVVDPWRCNHTPLSLKSLDRSREISGTVRVGKAALANRGDLEAVILGSSRLEIALDPAHPGFGGKRALNLAMSAAHVLETVPVGHYVLDRNPHIRTLVMGVEPTDLHSDLDTRKVTRFYESPFADNGRSIERPINQLIGGRSLLDSIGTVRRYYSGEEPCRNPLGQWVKPSDPPDVRAHGESVLRMGYNVSEDQWALRPQVPRMAKIRLLEGLLSRARGLGIEVHLLVTPQHALKLIHPTLDRPPLMCWEADLRALADLCRKVNQIPASAPPAKFWNFFDFNGITCEPLPAADASDKRMRGWYDLGHGRTVMGNHMLATMLADRPGVRAEKAGECLSEGDWEAHRAAWVGRHARYCEEHRADVDWWRGILRETEGTVAAAAIDGADAEEGGK